MHHDLKIKYFLGNISPEQRVTIAMNLSCDKGLFVTGLYFPLAILTIASMRCKNCDCLKLFRGVKKNPRKFTPFILINLVLVFNMFYPAEMSYKITFYCTLL